MDVLDRLLLELFKWFVLCSFGLDDCLGFGLRETGGQSFVYGMEDVFDIAGTYDAHENDKGKDSEVRRVLTANNSFHPGASSGCVLFWVPDKFFCFSSSSAFPSASETCLHERQVHCMSRRERKGRMQTHDLTGIARVAETENARTGALKADRKMLVDCDSMLVVVRMELSAERGNSSQESARGLIYQSELTRG